MDISCLFRLNYLKTVVEHVAGRENKKGHTVSAAVTFFYSFLSNFEELR